MKAMMNTPAGRRFKRNFPAKLGLTVLAALVLLAVLAPLIAPSDPDAIVSMATIGPGLPHLFGTDEIGRDILSRCLFGARISLSVGLIAVVISIVIGTILGAVSGYLGGLVDSLVMRFVDIMLAFPSIFLILTIQAMFTPSITNVMIVIGLTSWMGVARLVRGEFLSLKERDFVEAARALGVSTPRIIFGHILPNTIGPISVAATLGVAGAILTESALSFLGLGVQPPLASWGSMLTDSQAYMRDAWWLAFFPGVLILITVLSIYFVGEGLRDALDPRGE